MPRPNCEQHPHALDTGLMMMSGWLSACLTGCFCGWQSVQLAVPLAGWMFGCFFFQLLAGASLLGSFFLSNNLYLTAPWAPCNQHQSIAARNVCVTTISMKELKKGYKA